MQQVSKNKIAGVFFFLMVLLSGPFSGHSQLEKNIDSVVKEHINRYDFSGTVLVSENNKVLYENSTGFSDELTKIPITSATRFSLASIGKLFTGTLIMKLVEEGKIKLDDVVDTYIPGYKIPNADKITIKHLLTHSAGLGEYMGTPEHNKLKGSPASIDDLVKIIAAQPLLFEIPGTRFQYSNSGFIILGKIIEQVENKKYFNVLEEKILKPLDMRSATFSIDLVNTKGFAKGYVAGEPGQWTDKTDLIPPSADGGLFITAHDLLKFDKALFGGKIISAASLEKMMQPQKGPYGYAMMITKISNGTGYGHNGGMPGYEAEYRHFFIDKKEYSIIILTNHDRRAMRFLFDLSKQLEKIESHN